MRTTLDIEPDILQAAKEIAAKEGSTAGAVLSRLARVGLTPGTRKKVVLRNGVPVFPSTGHVITNEHVRRLMDEEGI